LEIPTITIQSTVGAYGHISTSRIWNNGGISTYEINLSKEQELKYDNLWGHGFTPNTKCTFKEHSEIVMKNKQLQGLKRSTLERYQELLDVAIAEFGYKRIGDITTQDLNSLYYSLTQPGKNKKDPTRGLSSKTIKEIHNVISMVFTSAYQLGLVEQNPAERATRPKAKRPEPNYYQPEQVALILKYLDEEPIERKALIYVMLLTGARRGEILGAKWESYDEKTGVIYLTSTVLRGKKKDGKGTEVYESQTPKTEASVRYVKLPPLVIDILKEYKVWQEEQKEFWGDAWIDSPFIRQNGEE